EAGEGNGESSACVQKQRPFIRRLRPPLYPVGRAIGTSAKILYCCARGLAASAASTNCSELLPSSARGRIITRMKRLGCSAACAKTGSGPLSYQGPPRAEGGERPAGVGGGAAPDRAAGARPRRAVGGGAAAGRKGDAVAAQEKLARRQGGERHGKLFARGHAGRSASGRRSKVETPAGRACAARVNRRRAFAVPGLAV